MDNAVFKWNTFFMRLSPMYTPKADWSIAIKFLYYLWKLIWMMAFVAVVLIALDIVWRDEVPSIPDIAMNIMYIELYISISSRIVYISYEYPKLNHLADRLVTDFKFQTKLSPKPKNMDGMKKFINKFVIFWLIFVMTGAWFMAISNMLRTNRTLPVPVWLWYDWKPALLYYPTVFVETMSLTLMLTTFGNMDMLNSTFMLLTSGEIDLLALDFASIFSDALVKQGCTKEEVMEYTIFDNIHENVENRLKFEDKLYSLIGTENFKNDLWENLRYCVEHHQKLLTFIEDYQTFISPYLLVEVGFIFSYLIFMMFIFVVNDDNSLYGVMIQFVCGSTMQIFLASYLGDRMTESLEKMRLMFYGIPWYLCDKRFLENFKIVQIRMSKPVQITAGKLLSMSLDMFLEFMKKAFSVFTVLRQTNNK